MIPSLKRLLLIWLLVPLLIIMPVAAVVQYWLALIPAKQEIDHQLGDIAIAISGFLKVEGDSVRFDMNPETEHLLRTDQLDKEFFVVLDPAGKMIAGDAVLDLPEAAIAAGELRYVDREIAGRAIRMLVYGVPCGSNTCQVRIAETLVKRERLHFQALIATLLSILVLGLSTAGVMLLAVRHGLRPLQDLRTQLAERSLGDLRPLDVPKIPSEVQPLVNALNQLLVRLDKASKAQQSFLADAAHQLRTPLSVLQTESELALLEPHPQSLHATLQRLQHSASRAAKLANQLLTIARADSSVQKQPDFGPLDLKDIASWAANEWSHLAFVAGVDLGFELQTAPVNGQSLLLQELLSNLIHNSIEHAGKGAQVTIRTYIGNNAPILEVEDDGPGIMEEERQKVLQRFFRGSQAKGSGSGLGLAIVKEIARTHSAKVSLNTPDSGRGLLVRVTFNASRGTG
ncbi:MAG: sensor histidine kinase [Gallionella sp.]|nr:sensor histidine kinase [Gallionella sp.]